MSTHNICFYGEIGIIIPNYPQIPPLSVLLSAFSGGSSLCLFLTAFMFAF